MELSEGNSEKKHAQALELVRDRVEEMQREVLKALSEVAVMEEGLLKDGEKILG